MDTQRLIPILAVASVVVAVLAIRAQLRKRRDIPPWEQDRPSPVEPEPKKDRRGAADGTNPPLERRVPLLPGMPGALALCEAVIDDPLGASIYPIQSRTPGKGDDLGFLDSGDRLTMLDPVLHPEEPDETDTTRWMKVRVLSTADGDLRDQEGWVDVMDTSVRHLLDPFHHRLLERPLSPGELRAMAVQAGLDLTEPDPEPESTPSTLQAKRKSAVRVLPGEPNPRPPTPPVPGTVESGGAAWLTRATADLQEAEGPSPELFFGAELELLDTRIYRVGRYQLDEILVRVRSNPLGDGVGQVGWIDLDDTSFRRRPEYKTRPENEAFPTG